MKSRASLESNVASKLETILDIESEALSQWMTSQKQLSGFLADDHELAEMVARHHGKSLVETSVLDEKLKQISAKLRNQTCLLMTVDGSVVASCGQGWLVEQAATLEDQFCATLMSGETTMSPVFSHRVGQRSEEFAAVIASPVMCKDGHTVGFLGIGHNLTATLTDVLASSRSGRSGESLAVAKSGQLITKSRFGDFQPARPYAEIPLSVNVDLSGSPDHRGVRSVVASKWNPELDLGLITKMDYAEAYAPIHRVFYYVWVLFGLSLLTACSTLFYRWYLMRLRQSARYGELAKKRLGAYELEGKIGEGGMGVVYEARHALLRRPTAVKILPPEKSNCESITRFEREVQFTSKLKHPNTISIYDYGRTENGLFYYAMELLEGMNLEQLVKLEGPLPDGRVINLLRQACQSIREAHLLGLVHRDIKPSNIMLCNRGGAYDTVKVLDFGMVRDQKDVAGSSGNDALAGTPIYMAPECFTNPQQVDARADIFALGAVGFFVLTGKPLFDVNSLDKLLDLQIMGAHVWAKQQFERAMSDESLSISDDLICLVCDCLARFDVRPSRVEEVLERLSKCQPSIHWGQGSAEKWWKSNLIRNSVVKDEPAKSGSVSPRLDETQVFDSDHRFQQVH